MLQRQWFRYRLALLYCGLILTAGCNSSRKTESATTTPRAAIVGEDSRAPLADSPEQLIGRRLPPIQVGDREKAIETVRLAIDGINRLKGSVDFGDLEIQCQDALKAFETPAKEQ